MNHIPNHTKPSSFLTVGLAAALALPILSGTASAAVILGTGWTEDVVIEAEAASVAAGYTGRFFNRATIPESGFSALGALSNALVISTSSIVTTDNGTDFFVDPLANNSIDEAGGTLTLTTAAAYQDLQFLVFGIGANAVGDNFEATINFDTGPTTILTFHVKDWAGSQSYNAFDDQITYIIDDTATPDHYVRELTFDLSPADEAKNITSIDFVFASGSRLAVLGVSGAPVPEPSSTALLGLGGLALILRRRK